MKVENCGDIMFCELNIEIMLLNLVNLTLSMRIIVDIIRPLSMETIIDLYMFW